MIFRSKVGLGTSGYAWKEEMIPRHQEKMAKAIEMGYRLFDTAEQYADGRAETMLGKAIAESGVPREEFDIVSKIQPMKVTSRSDLRSVLQGTLDRLQTDYVDAYLLHWFGPNLNIEQCVEWWAELVRDGLIRHVGVSNLAGRTIAEWQHYQLSYPKEQHLKVIQFRYGPVHRFPDQHFMSGNRVVSWNTSFDSELTGMPHSIFGGGRSSGYQRPEQNPSSSYRGDFWEMPELKLIKPIADSIGATIPQLLIAFFNLRHPWAVSIPKSFKPNHLQENLDSVKFTSLITNSITEEINKIFPVLALAKPESYETRK
jgi:aryl-alcohol dehydrogenase-like predicted oxidoreductase